MRSTSMFTTLVAALLAAPVAYAQEPAAEAPAAAAETTAAAPETTAAAPETTAAAPETAAAPAVAVAKPAPSLPWLLRPTAAGNVVRSDTVFGSFDGGSAVTTGLLASYKLRPDLALGARLVFSVLSPDQYGAPRAPVEVVAKAAPWFPLWIYSIIPAFAVFNTGIANLIMASRLLYGMAQGEHRQLPARARHNCLVSR